jgi:hypothetical protein
LKRIRDIIAFAVLACLVLTSIQTVLADSTVTCNTLTNCTVLGPGIAPGSPFPNSPFNANFITITGSSVTLGLVMGTQGLVETYTFVMKIAASSMPSDWMQPGWQPTWASPNQKMHVTVVGYSFILDDSLGHFLGFIHVIWYAKNSNWEPALEAIICNRLVTYKGCIDSVGSGVGNTGGGNILYPPSLKYSLSTSTTGSTVTLTISQSDLNNINSLFSTVPTQWRALAAACQNMATSSESCTGYATYPRLDLPT